MGRFCRLILGTFGWLVCLDHFGILRCKPLVGSFWDPLLQSFGEPLIWDQLLAAYILLMACLLILIILESCQGELVVGRHTSTSGKGFLILLIVVVLVLLVLIIVVLILVGRRLFNLGVGLGGRGSGLLARQRHCSSRHQTQQHHVHQGFRQQILIYVE